MPLLYIYPKKGDSSQISLDKEKMSIGRSVTNNIPIPDPFSSNVHAFITMEGEKFFIQDNASKNGIFVNSLRIQTKVELNRGDEILIGSTRIVFDRELNILVEITNEPSSSSLDTVMPIKDILRKPDISTAIRGKSQNLIVSEVAKALMLHVEIPKLLEHIMDLINDYIPLDRGVLMLYDGQPPRLLEKASRIKKEIWKDSKFQLSQSIISLVVEQQSAILIPATHLSRRFNKQDSVVVSKILSAICVPLWNDDEIIGIVYADRISIQDQFTKDDLKVLTLLSNLAAVKIEQVKSQQQRIETEKIQSQIKFASEIQQRLLPQKNPDCENYEIVGINIPCHQVGGDYYDFIEINPERLGVVIADVSGKGVGPGLYMTGLRGWLYREIHPEHNIETMAANLNDFIHGDTKINDFISFFYGELYKESGEIKYINAGHNPPIIISKDKKVHHLETCGLCLGMFPSEKYEIKSKNLEPGDIAVLFTDGIIESRNIKDEEFTEEGLIKLLKKHTKSTASEILEAICSEVKAFASGVDQFDDMTVVIIKRIA